MPFDNFFLLYFFIYCTMLLDFYGIGVFSTNRPFDHFWLDSNIMLFYKKKKGQKVQFQLHAKLNENNIFFSHNLYKMFNVLTTCYKIILKFLQGSNIYKLKKDIPKFFVLHIALARISAILPIENNSYEKFIRMHNFRIQSRMCLKVCFVNKGKSV